MLFAKYEIGPSYNHKGSDKLSGSRYFAPSIPLRPFDIATDSLRYVDGKPRYEGVRSFLESRSIDLPYGNPEEPPNLNTICGLGNRKNELVNELLASEGVEV
jgi:alpha,alpha-trehalase